MSMTLSRKWTAFLTVDSIFFQSVSYPGPPPFVLLLTMRPRFMEPRLQDSYGRSGCSPHGLVDSISPMCGVGLKEFMRSMNITPGSPFFHAISTILSKTSLALLFSAALFVLGFMMSYSPPSLRAFMKPSVRLTDMLKLLSLALSSLQVMKFIMSGWSTRSIPMFAPLLVPPCLMASVALSKTVMKDMGPEDMPDVEPPMSPEGRS